MGGFESISPMPPATMEPLSDAAGAISAWAGASTPTEEATLDSVPDTGAGMPGLSAAAASVTSAVETMLEFGRDADLGPTGSQDLGPSEGFDKVMGRTLTQLDAVEMPHNEGFEEMGTGNWLSPNGSAIAPTMVNEPQGITFATAANEPAPDDMPHPNDPRDGSRDDEEA